MRPLSASELLAVWERGLAQPPVQRALTLLSVACPDSPLDVLAQLSIGQRDALLLTLREWAFGPELACLVTCPGCGEQLELTFNVADIRAAPENELAPALSLSVTGYTVSFRLPNSLDLAAVVDAPDVAATRRLLLERCLLDARRDGKEVAFDRLPADVMDAIVERMSQADPQTDVQLALTCPECEHRWPAIFDIVSFFWSEVNVWAYRVLHQVHVLASAYGWREADILAMSPWRRQLYLEMVGGF